MFFKIYGDFWGIDFTKCFFFRSNCSPKTVQRDAIKYGVVRKPAALWVDDSTDPCVPRVNFYKSVICALTVGVSVWWE